MRNYALFLNRTIHKKPNGTNLRPKQDGCPRNNYGLNNIGEAVDKIPKTVKYNFRKIPWRTWERMRETRNELAHGHYNVKPEALWAIVKYELPPLKPLIKEMREDIP